jgi:hypothetical protein
MATCRPRPVLEVTNLSGRDSVETDLGAVGRRQELATQKFERLTLASVSI